MESNETEVESTSPHRPKGFDLREGKGVGNLFGSLSIPSAPVCKAVYTSQVQRLFERVGGPCKGGEREARRGIERWSPSLVPPPRGPSGSLRSSSRTPHQRYERTRGPPVPRMDPARFSADPTHSVPIRPIRCILTRAHEPSQRANERTERPTDRANEVGPQKIIGGGGWFKNRRGHPRLPKSFT